ncbi:MAG: diaminopimelate epimerase [Acidimicrobiales bacterium]
MQITPQNLVKLHGAGNDFLVLLDEQDRWPLDASWALAVCDRRRGIGADGMIRLTRTASGLAMELRNADGSPAEMSGNGIRCLVQAAVDAGWVALDESGRASVAVDTDAGLRQVDYRTTGTGRGHARVAMGMPQLGEELLPDDGILSGQPVRAARVARMGNPHIVLMMDEGASDGLFDALGRALSERTPEGANVEFVVMLGPDEISMRVWERGVGETLACGTGSCAAAAVVHAWGEVGTHVTVHNPGGLLEVELVAEGAFLSGPVEAVGDVMLRAPIGEIVIGAAP